MRTQVVHLRVDRELPLILLQGAEGLLDASRLECTRDAAVCVIDDFLAINRELASFGEVESGVDGIAIVFVWNVEEVEVSVGHGVGSRQGEKGAWWADLRGDIVLAEKAERHVGDVGGSGE